MNIADVDRIAIIDQRRYRLSGEESDTRDRVQMQLDIACIHTEPVARRPGNVRIIVASPRAEAG